MNTEKPYSTRKFWLDALGTPRHYAFTREVRRQKEYDFGDFTAELYLQANGPGTFQRVLLALPRKRTGKLPAVAVPFYFPEAMIGYDLETGGEEAYCKSVRMAGDLVRRGYAVISADAYHLTYRPCDLARNDFRRWHLAGTALKQDHPEWTGIGKLTADTMLLIDLLEADPRIDPERIGIAGHSLGGKMAFYTGFLDPRIKAVMASDFGIGWDQTNWQDIWYWGDKVEELKKAGAGHAMLMGTAPKPFALIAGCYDNEESFRIMQCAPGYEKDDPRLAFYHHATGHTPPTEFLHMGYDFLDRQL